MKPFKKPKNVYAFIDSQNLNMGTQKVGWKMDWRKFRQFLKDKYGVSKAYMFIGHMPEHEDLATIGATRATLAIHLSVNNLAHVVKELSPLYGEDCPVVVAYRVSWPDQAFLRGTLSDIRAKVKDAGFTRTALVLVGRVLEGADFTDSRLYAPDHTHILRP